MTRPFRFGWALAALCAGGPAVAAQFVAPEGKAFHNGSSVVLEDDGSSAALLRRLDQALVLDDAEEAARLVHALRARRSSTLVPFGPRTHLPALELAARRIVAGDAEAVRRRVERETAALVQGARRERDVEMLLDLATRGSVLAPAREAALVAARLLFEEGRWWAAAAMARRARDRPGAQALAEAAEGRLAAGTVAPSPGTGRWRWQLPFSVGLDQDVDAGVPLVADGREREILVLDARGLYGVDPWSRSETLGAFTWEREVLGEERYLVSLPSPFRYVLARDGRRLLIPFNVPREPRFRGKWVDRDARLLAVDLTDTDVLPALSETLTARTAGATVAWVGRVVRGEALSTAFGPPRVSGTRVFVQVFRTGPTSDVSLACFEVRTGERLFETPLARGAQVPRFASRVAEMDRFNLDKRAREGEVAVRDGIVYACTGYGIVAAVDGLTGAVLHTFRYDRVFSLDPGSYDPAFLFDTGGWIHEPVRMWGDRVVVAPSDSRFLYMLAVEPGPNGHLIREDPIERLDRLDVVALRPDPGGRPAPAVLCSRRRNGRGGLVLLGADGHVLEASPLLPAGEAPTGRALRVGQRVLMPTTAGVRSFSLSDLQATPALLPLPDRLRSLVPRGVFDVDGGVVAVAPVPGQGVTLVLCWADEP